MSMRDVDAWGGALSLREAMNRLLEDSFVTGMGPAGGTPRAVPMPLDLYETREALIVRTSLPGVQPDVIDITVTGDTLTIRGELREQPPGAEGRYHHREHRSGTLARSLTLPVEVQPDKVEATFEHGMLTLTLPKAARMRPTQIKIGTQGGVTQIGTQGAASTGAIEGQVAGSAPATGGKSGTAGGRPAGTAVGPSEERASTAPRRSRKKSTA